MVLEQRNRKARRKDAGFLSYKDHLPVSQVVVGDTDRQGSEAKLSVGPLRCQGDIDFIMPAEFHFYFDSSEVIDPYNQNAKKIKVSSLVQIYAFTPDLSPPQTASAKCRSQTEGEGQRLMSDMIQNLRTIKNHLICSQDAKRTWKHSAPPPSFPYTSPDPSTRLFHPQMGVRVISSTSPLIYFALTLTSDLYPEVALATLPVSACTSPAVGFLVLNYSDGFGVAFLGGPLPAVATHCCLSIPESPRLSKDAGSCT
ncbi:hypothetical protein CB1_001748011 [Camelus ferus]|nr:hypothetical protein CB1_001748011 [Camelus ferus]